MKPLDPQAVLAIANDRNPTLFEVLSRISERPHRELIMETPLVDMEGLTDPDTEGFLDLVVDPGALGYAKHPPVHVEVDGRRLQFTRVYDRRPRITFDTYPNRFVCHTIRRFRDALMSTDLPPGEARRLARRLQGLVRSSSLQEAGPLHHVSADHNVLRKDPLYQQVLRASVLLTKLILS